MQLQEILDYVDSHPNSLQLPGSYRGLSVGRVYIRAEMAGNRQVIITDRLTGVTVFVGSETGVELVVDGEWQNDLTEAIANPPEGMQPPVLASGGGSGDTRPSNMSSYPGPIKNTPKPEPTEVKEEGEFIKVNDNPATPAITPEVIAKTPPETAANIIANHELEANKDEPVVQEVFEIKNRE